MLPSVKWQRWLSAYREALSRASVPEVGVMFAGGFVVLFVVIGITGAMRTYQDLVGSVLVVGLLPLVAAAWTHWILHKRR
jgi:drug/metabolite transporter (DMT)-like permease